MSVTLAKYIGFISWLLTNLELLKTLPNKNTKNAMDITVAVATILPSLPRDQISFCTTSLLKALIPLSVYINKYPNSLKNWAVFFIKYLKRALKKETPT